MIPAINSAHDFFTNFPLWNFSQVEIKLVLMPAYQSLVCCAPSFTNTALTKAITDTVTVSNVQLFSIEYPLT